MGHPRRTGFAGALDLAGRVGGEGRALGDGWLWRPGGQADPGQMSEIEEEARKRQRFGRRQ